MSLINDALKKAARQRAEEQSDMPPMPGGGRRTHPLRPDRYRLRHPGRCRLFLREHGRYASRVARHSQAGNELLFGTVDALVKRFGKALAKKRRRAEAEA